MTYVTVDIAVYDIVYIAVYGVTSRTKLYKDIMNTIIHVSTTYLLKRMLHVSTQH